MAAPRLLLVLLCASACTVGDVTGPGAGGGADAGAEPDPAPDAAPATYALEVSPGPGKTLLGTTIDFEVTLRSDRFAGPVTLSVNDVPESWQVRFTPSAEIALAADGEAVVTLEVVIPTNGESGQVELQVQADAAAGTHQASAYLEVENEIVIPIAAGVGSGAHDYDSPITIRLGTRVTFVNYDSTAHRIHASDGDAGFPHQEGSMAAAPEPGQPGGTYVVDITRSGIYDFYCHTHLVGSGVGLLSVGGP